MLTSSTDSIRTKRKEKRKKVKKTNKTTKQKTRRTLRDLSNGIKRKKMTSKKPTQLSLITTIIMTKMKTSL